MTSIESICLFQIDDEVLQALPDDIRINIEQSLSVQRHHRGPSESSDRADEAEQHCQSTDVCYIDCDEQPGCSHWTADNAPASESAASALLPSYSQVIGHHHHHHHHHLDF